jgi:hypothetical protein
VRERFRNRALVLVELVRIRHPEPPQHAPAQPELDQIFVENAGVAVGGPRALRDAARRFAPGIGDTSAKRRAGDARLQQPTAKRRSKLTFVRTARTANVQRQRWTFSPTTTGRSLISKSTARPAPFFLMFSATGRCAGVAYCIAVGGLLIAAGPAPFYLMFPVIGSEPNRALERDASSKHHPVFADRVLVTLPEPNPRWAYFPMTFSALCHSLRDNSKLRGFN